MTQNQSSGIKSRKTVIVILVVLIVVLAVGITAVVLFVVNSESGTPEGTFRKMVNGMNDGDIREVYDTSVWKLSMTYEDFVDELSYVDFPTESDIDITYLEVILKDQLTQDQVDYIEALIPALEVTIGNTVDDYCMIDLTLNWTDPYELETDSVTGMMVCLKVDSKWYLLSPFADLYYDDAYDTPAATYSKAPVAGGEQIIIVSITRTDVSWDDITVQFSDGYYIWEWDTATYDLDGGAAVTCDYGPLTALSGVWASLNVTDLSGNGLVNGADYFRIIVDGGLDPGTTYSAVLIYIETGEKIGTGVTFTG